MSAMCIHLSLRSTILWLALALYGSLAAAQTELNGESATDTTAVTESDVKNAGTEQIPSSTNRDQSESKANRAADEEGEIIVPTVNEETQAEAEQIIGEVKKRVERYKTEEEERLKPPAGPGVIRINHVPDFIKEEIKEQVRMEVREDVVRDILSQAKQERWGMPGVTPEWVDRIKWKGDFRFRAQHDGFADDNTENSYIDFQTLNENGGFGKAGIDAFMNTTESRDRLRLRARLAMNAKVTNNWNAGFRISTGSTKDPVSTNQSLGNSANKYAVVWDQAYLKFDDYNTDDYKWLTMSFGRMSNPFLSTDLVWDSDVNFEGLAAKFRFNLRGSEDLFEITEHDRTFFFSLGAFPIQEVALSAEDKWLYGAQLGTTMISESQSRLDLGIGYYYFSNITGKRNSVDSVRNDYTAPSYMQRGNTLFDIRNDDDVNTDLWALASEFKELTVTLKYDMTLVTPLHLTLVMDYVKNLGWNEDEISKRTGGAIARAGGVDPNDPLGERTTGYQIKFVLGWPDVTLPGNWRSSVAYKHLERDAVLDAYTDSDFHLGGTDAEGWILGVDYGLTENAWASFKYLTADAIDGIPLGIDIIQLDLNAKF